MHFLENGHDRAAVIRSAYLVLTVALGLKVAVLQSASATLGGTHHVTDRGSSAEYVVAADEISHRSEEGTSVLISIPEGIALDDTLAFAKARENTHRGDSRLVMYPSGADRNESSRRYLTRRILVRMNPGTDPLSVRTATGANYEGELTYAPDYHLYSYLEVGDSLLQLATVRQLPGVLSADPLLARTMTKRFVPNDVYFTNQWHLLNTGQNTGALPGIDINVTNIWDRYRGSNVVVAVVDDGLELAHEDLTNQLATGLHLDINGSDTDPSPGSPFDSHGTSVGGAIGAQANNSNGIAGVAFQSRLAGIRLIAGPITDADEAQAMTHRLDAIHVSNNSWGPPDDGQLHQVGILMSNALYQGVSTGRGGRGSIYVWAGGNGGDAFTRDNSNYDAWANQIYTIAVGALGDNGIRADYSEPGANLVITAPSQEIGRPGIVTTDLMGTNGSNAGVSQGNVSNANYTFNFNGTSASSPIAAGGIALLLEANPSLGWRDVQEILIRSATQIDTNNPANWATNSAGFTFNHEHGAGLINVGAAIALATNWTNLSLQTNISLVLSNLAQAVPDAIPQPGLPNTETPLTNRFTFAGENVRVEHVQLRVSLNALPTRFLGIKLRSPSGMESVMFNRTNSTTGVGMDFTFMSVRHWGETILGNWEVEITDTQPGQNGILDALQLTIYGTSTNSISATNPPTILAGGQPKSKTVTKGSVAFFRVLPAGTPPLTYVWTFTDQQGASHDINNNSPSLFINNVSSANQGVYAARIFNSFGNVLSAPAALLVNSPPEIASSGQPTNQHSLLGGTATFSVGASGAGPLQYQWRRNNQPIANATSSSLSLTNLQTGDFTTYDVTVRNTIASIISQPVTLSALQGVSFTALPTGLTNGVFQFGFSGVSGQKVQIEGSTNLTNWIQIDTRVLTGGSAVFTDPSAGTFPTSRYYRVVPLP